MADKSGKKTRKAITLNTKVKIIKLSAEGISNSEIGRRLGLARTTVFTVLKNKKNIISEVKNGTPVHTTIIRKRDSLISDMEKLLMIWIDDQTSRNASLSTGIIRNKAQTLFDEMKAKKGEAAKNAEFGASRGWFDRFKRRSKLHDMKVQDEISVADIVGAESSSRNLVEFIDDSDYSEEKKIMPGFNSIKYSLTECSQWFDGFERFETFVPDAINNTVQMESQLNLKVEPVDVSEFLEPEYEPLSNEDPLALQENKDDEEMPEDISSSDTKGLTTKVLTEAIRHFEIGMALLAKHDSNSARSSTVRTNLVKDYACYTAIYIKKKRQSSTQTTLDRYFKKIPPQSVLSVKSPIRTSTQSSTPSKSLFKSRTSKRAVSDDYDSLCADIPISSNFLQ